MNDILLFVFYKIDYGPCHSSIFGISGFVYSTQKIERKKEKKTRDDPQIKKVHKVIDKKKQ